MSDVDAVIAAEHERCRATSEHDWTALEALLDASLTHTHMNGRVDDRAALLANVRARPRTLRRGELHVRLFGDCAVMTGPQFLDLGATAVRNLSPLAGLTDLRRLDLRGVSGADLSVPARLPRCESWRSRRGSEPFCSAS